MNPIIGVLAGMGPKSTAPFIDQLIKEYQKITGVQDDIDFPPIIIYSLPTPFYVNKPIDHALMQKTLCEGLKKLESCKVSFIAMPCNTAHIYFEALQKCISIPLLNMIDETMKGLSKENKKITIFATRSTLETGLYQKELIKKGLEDKLYLVSQEKIDYLILQIKKGISSRKLRQIWQSISTELQEKNVDTILIACTDLNVVFDSLKTSFHMIDSSYFLATAIIKKYLEIIH